MPGHEQRQGSTRQRPVSCRFCRTRKLRCNREAPCSNCVSRGIRCELESSVRLSNSISSASENAILERLQRLEKLLVLQHKDHGEAAPQVDEDHNPDVSESQEQMSQPPALSPQIQGLDHDVAWLESIYAGQRMAQNKILVDKAIFRVCPIEHIKTYRAHSLQYELPFVPCTEPTRCIWLPQYAEAKILLEKFLCETSHFPYVVHVPSVPQVVEDVYTDLSEQGQVKSGHAILLISIFACATQVWAPQDCERGLFATIDEAHEQAALWVKAAQDVIDIAQRSVNASLEGVQGVIILAFVLANIEGITPGCRSLYATALIMARDLGLHRVDHPSNKDAANTAQAEIGRRIWWYLCASDWQLAAKFPGMVEGVYSCHPRQMITSKPLNINDDQVFDGMSRTERPLSEPTTMSYSLQRLRLGEISRSIVDRTPLAMANNGGPSRDDIMDIDFELQMFINDIPPFFSMPKAKLMETYHLSPVQASNIAYQGLVLLFLTYAQRCKTHLPYFARGYTDMAYSASRDACIKSARLIIQSQTDIADADLSVVIRLKFASLLMGVFMASIVLLMDLCVNRTSPQREQQRQEVAKAFKILERAKSESETTAKFVDSLMQFLRKHKIAQPKLASTQQTQIEGNNGQPLSNSAGEVSLNDSTNAVVESSAESMDETSISNLPEVHGTGDVDMSSGGFINGDFISGDLGIYFDELTQSFQQGNDVGNFNWNNIFSDLELLS